MTEYTTSSQAVREYMSSRERTAYWVQSHDETDFYSPSVPPTVLDDWTPSSPVSEAASSRSIPPRMVLRWGNGAPDVPIPNSAEPHRSGRPRRRQGESRSRSPTSPTSSNFHHHRSRSGSHPSSPLAQGGSHRPNHYSERTPLAPEEIRVLPSNGPALSHPSSSGQPRSKSLPRSADLPPPSHAVPGLPGPMPRARTPYPLAPLQGPPPATAAAQRMPFTPQPWHPYTQGRPPHHTQKQPPAIIYAPSPTSSRPRYAPPVIYHHPPQMGPNGMIYSHSAPVNSSHHSNGGGLPSTMVPPAHTLSQVREEDQRAGTWSGRSNKRLHDRGRSLSVVPPPLSPSSSSSSLNSGESGSTYYVLPSAGQKVHVISPSPQPSIHTATSTTRSPTSPRSFKKAPFFQRLFNFAGKFSSSSSTKAPSSAGGMGRRLQRRHSTGGAGRRPEVNRH
ncbi:hypothetical protein FPV67DRAFT_2423 [Lyophyllum atratum]|nr:hypothetical protein FPV67DRAFT_2423 [Lyophyllum atratum]